MKKNAAKSKSTAPGTSVAMGAPAGKRDPYFAKAIGKALNCLEMINQNPLPLSLTELNAHLGGAKSSIFRVLHTLESLGYIERDALGRYQPVAELRVADHAPYLRKMIESAESRMKILLGEFEETTSLAALFENHIEVVAVLESPHIIRMGTMTGRILPPHASSLGKSITAFQSEERQDKLLRSYGVYRYTEKTITDAAELKQSFGRIRNCGWASDCEENALGGICIGAPIFVGEPEAIGALSVSAPTMRVSDSTRDRIIAEVCRCSREISAELAAGSLPRLVHRGEH